MSRPEASFQIIQTVDDAICIGEQLGSVAFFDKRYNGLNGDIAVNSLNAFDGYECLLAP